MNKAVLTAIVCFCVSVPVQAETFWNLRNGECVEILDYRPYYAKKGYVDVMYRNKDGFVQSKVMSKNKFEMLKKILEENKIKKEKDFLNKEGRRVTEILEVKYDVPDYCVKCIKTMPDGSEWEITKYLSPDAFKKLKKIVKENQEQMRKSK